MVYVIGGLNMDISGTGTAPLLARDSNIAHITLTAGGVGRNIALCLKRSGLAVELVAPLGDDPFAAALRADCEKNGIGLTHAPLIPGARSGIYLCVNEPDGDMFIGMNDMALYAALKSTHIPLGAINRGSLCVLDANLNAQTLGYLAENVTVPLFCDPVSAAKAERIRPLLPALAGIKPNLLEAQYLTGEQAPDKAAKALVKLGAERAFVSLGADGICYADSDGCGFAPAEPVRVENTTGAGDAAMAALCVGYLRGMGTAETAALACHMAAAHIQKKEVY